MSRRDIKLAGILNTTPDSFSDGGRYVTPEVALWRAYDMFREGASMVDVGGESTRPGAEPVPHEVEYERIAPLLQELIPGNTDAISVDTYHPETVRRIAAEIGPFVVNDVTGMNNPAMREAVAELGLRCILSHLPRAVGQDIQKAHQGDKIDSVHQVVEETGMSIDECLDDGIDAGSIWVDPGFAYGKDPRINNDLLRFPILMDDPRFEYYLGASRKSSLRRKDFYGEPLADFDSMSKESTELWLDQRSLEVAKVAVANGFNIIRVHNVALHAELLTAS